MKLLGKHIVLGITGGIAAYKSAELLRLLRQAGAEVRVIMTPAAKEFITPLTMQALSGHPVHHELFDLSVEAAMGHIELARWADLIVIAPASADCLANLANGKANDLLSTVCLATTAKIVIAPAMNEKMWHAAATQENLAVLQRRGVVQYGPVSGEQACGDVGLGRLMEPVAMMEQLLALFATGSLSGKQVIISAGPTHEALDPVRYLTNHSSGKMGYALAQAAKEAGAAVTLVSGPVNLSSPAGVKLVKVISAVDMLAAVLAEVVSAHIFIAAAAVADYTCHMPAENKIKKDQEHITLKLDRTPDILAAVAKLANRPFCVGFAAETEELLERAKAKLNQKRLDMIVANCVNQPGIGFGSDYNAVTVLTAKQQWDMPMASKNRIAQQLIALIAEQTLSISE